MAEMKKRKRRSGMRIYESDLGTDHEDIYHVTISRGVSPNEKISETDAKIRHGRVVVATNWR